MSDRPQAGPGRPRDPSIDRRIERAAAELLAAGGMSALSVDAVARRAGVARTTVYRRWSSPVALAFAAVRHPPRLGPPPDTGSLAGDLEAIAQQVVETLSAPGARAAIGAIVANGGADPAGIEAQRAVIAAERAWVDTILARHRDCVARDIGPDEVVDLLAGAVVYRLLLRGQEGGAGFAAELARRVARCIA